MLFLKILKAETRRSTLHVDIVPCADDDLSNHTHWARREHKIGHNQDMAFTKNIDEQLVISAELFGGRGTALKTKDYQLGSQQTTLPFDLHRYSTELFISLAPYVTTYPQLLDSSHSIQEDMGRLSLWGEAFGDGRLNLILQSFGRVEDYNS
jgi:hypothetical protein